MIWRWKYDLLSIWASKEKVLHRGLLVGSEWILTRSFTVQGLRNFDNWWPRDLQTLGRWKQLQNLVSRSHYQQHEQSEIWEWNWITCTKYPSQQQPIYIYIYIKYLIFDNIILLSFTIIGVLSIWLAAVPKRSKKC